MKSNYQGSSSHQCYKQRNIWFPLIFSTLIALVFTFSIFRNFSYWGIQDWDAHLFYHAVPRHTLIEYHQFPLWNPYNCGGTVMLANPESSFLSPWFLLILIFGTVKGIKLAIFLHLIIGLLGMYLLARHYKLDALTASLPACVYMLSSMYALNLTVGMTWFLSVVYLPWAFLCYLKGFKKWKFTLLSGLFLVLMYFEINVRPMIIDIETKIACSVMLKISKGSNAINQHHLYYFFISLF